MYWECVCRVCSDRSSTCTAVLEFRVWTPVKGCSYLGKNISMWLMASQWQPPERLETLKHSLQSKNLDFVFCPSKKWQRLVADHLVSVCFSAICSVILLFSIYLSFIRSIYHSAILSIFLLFVTLSVKSSIKSQEITSIKVRFLPFISL